MNATTTFPAPIVLGSIHFEHPETGHVLRSRRQYDVFCGLVHTHGKGHEPSHRKARSAYVGNAQAQGESAAATAAYLAR